MHREAAKMSRVILKRSVQVRCAKSPPSFFFCTFMQRNGSICDWGRDFDKIEDLKHEERRPFASIHEVGSRRGPLGQEPDNFRR